MLSEKDNVDRLFQEKLKNYEETPPDFLWENIAGELNVRKGRKKVIIIRIAGIAAAIMIAFLTGWWTFDSTNQGQNPTAESAISPVVTPQEKYADQKNISTQEPAERKKPSLSSMASFAVNTSLIPSDPSAKADGNENTAYDLTDIEKKFLSHFGTEAKILNNIKDWFTFTDPQTQNTPEEKPRDEIAPGPIQFQLGKAEDFDLPGRREPGRNHEWSLSIKASPVFTNLNQASGGQKSSAENTLSGAIIAGYKLGKRLTVKSGIIVSQLKQQTDNFAFSAIGPGLSSMSYASNASSSSGNVRFSKILPVQMETLVSSNIPPQVDDTKLSQELDYLEIPFLATYALIDGKFNLGLTGGISANILTGNQATISESNHLIGVGETRNMRDVNYSGAIGIEMGFDLGENISLTIEPRIKHYMNSLSSDPAINFRPYQLGVFTGLTYSFN